MRQSLPLAVLVVALAMLTLSIDAANTLREGRTDSLITTEAEERRFKIPGLNKLSSLFKKNPKIGNAIASNPSIANAMKDPTVTKTITTLKNKPGFLAKLRKTTTYKEIAPKLKTDTLTTRDIERLGQETVKASGKKGSKYAMAIAAAATIVGLVGIALVGYVTSESE